MTCTHPRSTGTHGAVADMWYAWVQPTGREENYKVRDVKYDRQLGRLVTLTTNGAVQLWDPHLSHIRTVSPPLPIICKGPPALAVWHGLGVMAYLVRVSSALRSCLGKQGASGALCQR